MVWMNTLLTNMYGGMITFHSLGLAEQMSIAQVTVLAQLMLVAHTFPIELSIARKAGIPLLTMLLWRFVLAIVSAWLLYHLLSFAQALQGPIDLPPSMTLPGNSHETWPMWIGHEMKRYLLVFVVVFALMTVMRFLKATGLMEAFARALRPVMNWLGIHASVIPITVVGMTLGILYGGALMIEETRKHQLAPKEVFYAFCLMGLCHSIIEDSLLMMTLGANGYVVFLYRPICALLTLFLAVRLFNFIPPKISKWIMQRK
jgi:spore maturation protein SpmB